MLVCENHPDKAWPDECDCGPGMRLIARPKTGDYTFYDCPETGEVFASKGAGLKRVARNG